GHTWKAFGEDASGTGCGLNPPRGEDHFPFLSYTTITGSPSRCANLLPGSGNEVINAFNAGTNFIWLTPNDCNNMHSCSVATGDNYIHGWVPQLLTAMNGKKALLILTFDEAYTNPPYIYHAFIGPAAKLAYKSTVEYTHYSLAKMIEDVWGGGNLGQNDVSANSPVEFFLPGGPDFGLVANPTSVSFAAGGSATSTISLTASGGFTGTVGLTAGQRHGHVRCFVLDRFRPDRDAPGPLGLGGRRDLGHTVLVRPHRATCFRRRRYVPGQGPDPGQSRAHRHREPCRRRLPAR